MENPIKILLKWMMLRGTPILGNLQITALAGEILRGLAPALLVGYEMLQVPIFGTKEWERSKTSQPPPKKKLLSCFPIFEHPLSNMLSDRNNSCRGNSVFCRGLDHISAF